MIAFGPVPSRRFGSSLGINNIPPKICTYGCVYCQIGETIVKSVERRHYYGKDRVVGEVYEKLRVLEKEGIKSDYLTFVPDGEPTLDIDLGKRGGRSEGNRDKNCDNKQLISSMDGRCERRSL